MRARRPIRNQFKVDYNEHQIIDGISDESYNDRSSCSDDDKTFSISSYLQTPQSDSDYDAEEHSKSRFQPYKLKKMGNVRAHDQDTDNTKGLDSDSLKWKQKYVKYLTTFRKNGYSNAEKDVIMSFKEATIVPRKSEVTERFQKIHPEDFSEKSASRLYLKLWKAFKLLNE